MTDRTNGHAPSELAAAVELAVAGLEDVERREQGSTVEFSRTGTVFAAIEGTAASYHLSPAVARAALATPDTAKSARGADWVTFSPIAMDRFALDRAVAWLESAWRNASR
jgi:hypothetical protein